MAEGGPSSAAAASSSSSTGDVNEQFLASLMEMGIHRDDARQVFLFCLRSYFRQENFYFRH
jgi:hypothetical protein